MKERLQKFFDGGLVEVNGGDIYFLGKLLNYIYPDNRILIIDDESEPLPAFNINNITNSSVKRFKIYHKIDITDSFILSCYKREKSLTHILYNTYYNNPYIPSLDLNDILYEMYEDIKQFHKNEPITLRELISSRKHGILDEYEPITSLLYRMRELKYGFDYLAGYEDLKEWVGMYKSVIANKDIEIWPKGIIISGKPGTGKSFAAKAIAYELGYKLYLLEPASIYDKYVGSSERNVRELIKSIDTMSNSIVLIDEIDKILTYGNQSLDAGVSQRVIGTLLSWLAERKPNVLIIGITNKLEVMPDEMIRRGRFDRIFESKFDMDQMIDVLIKKYEKYGITKEKIIEEASVRNINSGADLEGVVIEMIRKE